MRDAQRGLSRYIFNLIAIQDPVNRIVAHSTAIGDPVDERLFVVDRAATVSGGSWPKSDCAALSRKRPFDGVLDPNRPAKRNKKLGAQRWTLAAGLRTARKRCCERLLRGLVRLPGQSESMSSVDVRRGIAAHRRRDHPLRAARPGFLWLALLCRERSEERAKRMEGGINATLRRAHERAKTAGLAGATSSL